MTIIYAWIAQSVERVTVNHKVNGSIPFPGVIFQQLLKNKIITIKFMEIPLILQHGTILCHLF